MGRLRFWEVVGCPCSSALSIEGAFSEEGWKGRVDGGCSREVGSSSFLFNSTINKHQPSICLDPGTERGTGLEHEHMGSVPWEGLDVWCASRNHQIALSQSVHLDGQWLEQEALGAKPQKVCASLGDTEDRALTYK